MINFLHQLKKHNYYALKFLYHAFLLSIAILSIFIVFSEDTFSRYNELSDIHDFIQNQIIRRDRIISSNLKVAPLQKRDYFYLFVIDRTNSTLDSKSLSESLREFKKEILKNLRRNKQFARDNKSIDDIVDNVQFKQFLMAQSLDCIQNQLIDNLNVWVGIAYYNGDEKFLEPLKISGSDSINLWHRIGKDPYDKKLDDMKHALLDPFVNKITDHKTDFSRLTQNIIENYVKTIYNNDRYKIIITLISDFDHEEIAFDSSRVPVDSVDNRILHLSQVDQTDEVNIVKIPPNSQNRDESAKRIINLFRDHMRHFFYNEIKLQDLNDIQKISSLVAPLSFDSQNIGLKGSIVFYYPYKQFKYNELAEANVVFNDLFVDNNSTFYMTLKSYSNIETGISLSYGILNDKENGFSQKNVKYLKIGKSEKVKLDKNQRIRFQIPDDFSKEKLSSFWLEVYPENSKVRNLYPFILIERLSIIRIIVYRFFCIMISTLLLLFALMSFHKVNIAVSGRTCVQICFEFVFDLVLSFIIVYGSTFLNSDFNSLEGCLYMSLLLLFANIPVQNRFSPLQIILASALVYIFLFRAYGSNFTFIEILIPSLIMFLPFWGFYTAERQS